MSFYETDAEGKQYFYFQQRGMYETPAHFHSAIELLFVQSGEQEILIDGEKRILKEGEGCFVDSFSVHAYTPSQTSSVYILLGAKEYFEPTIASFGNRIPSRFFRFDDFDLLLTLLDLCHRKYKNEASMYETFEGCVKILLSRISNNVPLIQRLPDKQSELVNNILVYANEHLAHDLSLRTVATVFGYSHEHVSRVIHKYLRENWNAYVNRLRARRAERLLKERGYSSVLTIAYECGFDSPNTFYRAYRKEFGKTPRT